MRKYGFSALVAAGLLVGGLTASSASAADLGGNCCADLEERIAELEATTVRKGNRKVSVTLSGWVAEQVMWWDDGVEDNVYVQGIGTTLASHFKITGAAQISPGLSAGYVIHVEVYGSENLLRTNQIDYTGASLYDEGNDNFNGINTLQSYWFVRSNHMGKVSVGKQSMASDNTAILPDGSGSLVPANFVFFDYGGFFLRNADGSLSDTAWFQVMGCADCNGLPNNAVRYDSPTWHGFSVSSSWGDDDIWDVAARYAGEWHGFKVAAAAAYSETSDFVQPILKNGILNQAPDTQFFQIGAYAQHIPTGLWVYGAYTTIENDGSLGLVNGDDGYVDNDMWYIKAGLRERWHPLGHTVIYGEYQRANQDALFGDDELNGGPDCDDGGGPSCTAETNMWGLGIVQEVDAAAMSFWLSYRHLDADIKDVLGNNRGDVPVDDFQYVKFGALINF